MNRRRGYGRRRSFGRSFGRRGIRRSFRRRGSPVRRIGYRM